MKYRDVEYKTHKDTTEISAPDIVELEYDSREKSLWKRTFVKNKDEIKINIRLMDMPCEYKATEDTITIYNNRKEEQTLCDIYYIIDQLLDY